MELLADFIKSPGSGFTIGVDEFLQLLDPPVHGGRIQKGPDSAQIPSNWSLIARFQGSSFFGAYRSGKRFKRAGSLSAKLCPVFAGNGAGQAQKNLNPRFSRGNAVSTGARTIVSTWVCCGVSAKRHSRTAPLESEAQRRSEKGATFSSITWLRNSTLPSASGDCSGPDAAVATDEAQPEQLM